MSKIHWTDETINPVVGCSKVSAGCQNCYAENMARRLAAMGLPQYEQVVGKPPHLPAFMVNVGTGKAFSTIGWNNRTAFVPSELEKPYKWKKPRTIFISSMGDLFHKSVPVHWIFEIWTMISNLKRHTFIFLTKRPERMKAILSQYPVLPNLILGVSAEDQETADERIRVLLQIPAAKRFVSLEPMIGPVDLQLVRQFHHDQYSPQYGASCLAGISGVVLGGESGPKARPLDPAWVRLVRDQCAAAGTAFMFKQWHTDKKRLLPYLDTNPFDGLPLLDGRTHTELAWKTKKTP